MAQRLSGFPISQTCMSPAAAEVAWTSTSEERSTVSASQKSLKVPRFRGLTAATWVRKERERRYLQTRQ